MTYLSIVPIVMGIVIVIPVTQDPAFNSSGYILRSRIAGSHGNSIFNYLKDLTVFTIDYTILYSYQQCEKVPSFSIHSPKLVSIVFKKIDILLGMRWYFTEVFICISLMINDRKHLLCVYWPLDIVIATIYFD
jgi:hypothetical protein